VAPKGKTKESGKHKEPGKKKATPAVDLPGTREELLALHRETRARRNAAVHGSHQHVEAISLLERIEVHVARIERAMDPPRG